MGCDIHAHSELKINGKWHHMSELDIDRNYMLFTKMAGVRNYDAEIPISEARGIPKDVSELTKFLCDDYGSDGHSHSWLSSKEIKELIIWAEKELKWDAFDSSNQFGYLCGNGYDDWKPGDIKGLEDFRFVFWFDN